MSFKSASCLVGAMLALLLLGGLTTAWGDITGSAHDFSGAGWNSTGEICVVCHTPHNPLSTLVPLWNHATTTQSFTVYTSGTLNATGLTIAGVSQACLSCHDGVTAIDSFGGATGTNLISGSANLGIDLRNDHPVGFTYNAALATADGGLYTPVSTSWVDAAQTVPLYSALLECGSCHNVHDDTISPFLRKDNAGSALCITCHSK